MKVIPSESDESGGGRRIHQDGSKRNLGRGPEMDMTKEQCEVCKRWFKKGRGLKIHKAKSGCGKKESVSQRKLYKSDGDPIQESTHSDEVTNERQKRVSRPPMQVYTRIFRRKSKELCKTTKELIKSSSPQRETPVGTPTRRMVEKVDVSSNQSRMTNKLQTQEHTKKEESATHSSPGSSHAVVERKKYKQMCMSDWISKPCTGSEKPEGRHEPLTTPVVGMVRAREELGNQLEKSVELGERRRKKLPRKSFKTNQADLRKWLKSYNTDKEWRERRSRTNSGPQGDNPGN